MTFSREERMPVLWPTFSFLIVWQILKQTQILKGVTSLYKNNRFSGRFT